MKDKMLLCFFMILFLSFASAATLFEDNFIGSVKPEWIAITGDWEHNALLDAYQITYYGKGRTKVDIAIQGDTLVELKIIKTSTTQNTYFDLLNRYSFASNSGYSIAYMEVYSRFYGEALFLIRWENNSRKGYLDWISWDELSLSGITDLEGKIIGIKTEGNVVKGYLDGVEILSATDDTYTTGQAGLIANSGTEPFIFDDFKIEQLEEEKTSYSSGSNPYVTLANIEGLDLVNAGTYLFYAILAALGSLAFLIIFVVIFIWFWKKFFQKRIFS